MRKGNLDTGVEMHKGQTTSRPREKRTRRSPRERPQGPAQPQREPTLPTPMVFDFQPQNWETRPFCRLSCPARGSLLRQPETNTGTSPVVQWLRLPLPVHRVNQWVRFLVGELRSHVPRGQKTNKNPHQDIKQEQYCNKFRKDFIFFFFRKDFKNGPHQKKKS